MDKLKLVLKGLSAAALGGALTALSDTLVTGTVPDIMIVKVRVLAGALMGVALYLKSSPLQK